MHPSLQGKAPAGVPVPHILAAFTIHPMLGTEQTGFLGQIKMHQCCAGPVCSAIADTATQC
jgi:hypothetical protein